jgi:alpha-tubulin suppressor-like RCC1 family protein
MNKTKSKGNNNTNFQNQLPVLINELSGLNIGSIYSTESSSFAIDFVNFTQTELITNIYVTGKNQYSEFGIGSNLKYTFFTLNPNFNSLQIYRIVCSTTFCFFYGYTGLWYGTGSNGFAQMGAGSTGLNYNIPTPLTNVNNLGIDEIFAAGDSVIGINSNSGIAYGWGRNNYYSLGLFDNSTKVSPTYISFLGASRVKQVSMTEFSTLFLTTDGKVFGVGFNNNGELGIGVPTNVLAPQELQRNILKISSKTFSFNKKTG